MLGKPALLFPERVAYQPTKEDWATEYAAAAAFDRPPRPILTSTPFYPWMPKPYSVSFKLGFKAQ